MKNYLLLFSLLYFSCFSQQGSFDPTFNPEDNGLGRAANNVINTVALQSDGKMLIAGNFTSYDGATTGRLARLNTDGTLDTSFSCSFPFSSEINNMILQPDGKIIVTGAFWKIARFNPDGSQDTSFNAGGFSGNSYGLALHPDGRIFISGDFSIGSQSNVRIIGLNSNGTLNTMYTANGTINDIFFQPDGKLIANGSFSIFNGTMTYRFIRINDNGTIDTSFTPPGGRTEIIKMDQDGKIYINYVGILRRLNSNGTIDENFYGGSFPATSPAGAVALQQDGKIIVGGILTTNNTLNKLIRLNQDGTLDTSFDGNNGPMISVSYPNYPRTPSIRDIVIQSDGKIITVGDIMYIKGKTRNGIARVLGDGSLDTTFNKYMGFDGNVTKMLELPDHKILVIGSFKNYNELPANGIALLNENGSLNSNFVSSGTNGVILDMALKSDGKIIIVGNFTTYNNINSNYITSINQDGTSDTTFNIGTGASYIIRAVAIQPDGKIVIGGEFSYINGVFQRRTARLNPDGSVDPTFNRPIGTINTGYVDEIVVQPDGKILIAGNLVQPSVNMIKVNSDGSYDPSFTTPPYSANSMALQPDGKILIGGSHLIRANPNGSLDPSFNIVAAGSINKIVFLSDNKILIGGDFPSNSPINKNGIARINTDGTIDNSFITGTGTNNRITDMIVLHDQKLLIGGEFTSYNGNGKNHIARLNGSNVLSIKDITLNKDVKIYPNPVQNILYINSEKSIKKITIHNFLGQMMDEYKVLNISKTEIDVSSLSKGNYVVTIELETGARTFNLIKN